MNDYEREQIEKERGYMVVKSNDLVLKSRYQYSVYQQKTIAYICSLIKPSENDKKEEYQLDYEFEIAEYLQLLGVESSGKQYALVKETLQSLSNKSMWIPIKDENGEGEVLVRWLSNVAVYKKSGKVKIKLDSYLAPYLFNLKERYLSYGLINILNFDSKYSIRLYELLKAQYNLKRSQYGHRRTDTPTVEWIIELDELRHLLMLDVETVDENGETIPPKLTRFPDFRRKVLEIAQKEINELSDIKFFFEPIKKGKKVVKLRFMIMQKDNIERLVSQVKNRELLAGTEEKEN